MRPEDIAFGPRAFDVPTGRAPIRVSWLGTAGFCIEHDGYTVLIDPYVTRASLLACARAPLVSDADAVRRFAPKADAIVTGHTHFDHVLDVPAIARHTGAKVFGSRSCVHLCRIEGLPEHQVMDVESRRGQPTKVEVGPFELRFIPSVHAAFMLGRIPMPGDISDCDQIPLRTGHYRCGAVFGVDIRVAGKRLYHLGSADLLDAYPERDVDLLMMCVAGWTTTARFCPRVMGAIRPGAILLSHWDNFFAPMDAGAKALPAMQMPRLVEGLTAVDPSVRIGTVPLLGSVEL
ncbi:MAG: MBL fold metallo-hydrolase [Sandaracinaceae bacterium]|jgi:L-ascorbate metabolism protein UlaG (beta-lactamase superfamily)|nr:MBL fold metallo-hydrolase [Sandaracinaceae bacterium]MBK8588565.1 MBL fold metallo-hydrolase [Sandaracinaceae bacterium]MBP7684536.1 MBL fold metallo-hydrolase [Deltaproteobacteria bacterium]